MIWRRRGSDADNPEVLPKLWRRRGSDADNPEGGELYFADDLHRRYKKNSPSV